VVFENEAVHLPTVRQGSMVAFMSPSSGFKSEIGHRYQRARETIEDSGFDVIEYPTTCGQRDVGEAEAKARARDLSKAFRDDRVDVIIATIGGYRSNMLLSHLDFDEFRRNPTALVGYSDVTSLQLALYERADLVTFSGPTGLAELGEFPEPFEYTMDSLCDALLGNAVGPIEPAETWTDEFLDWSEKADLDRPRARRHNPGYEWLTPGAGTGPLIAANLSTLVTTPDQYVPDIDGEILLLEENAEISSVHQVEKLLWTLRQAGILQDISGLAFGRYAAPNSAAVNRLCSVLTDVTAPYDIPVVYGVDYGHTDPMITVPMGAEATLDAGSEQFRIEADVSQPVAEDSTN